ncbi:hypothetical protein MATL_G00186130 [Megalops atlanticus]|uniref:TOG domain-containing protein n=1 Tax=Megalops atlanticus TaxID=7932 RepID=A0A9D3T669_MEGAT|nr:hypothetical protein MATL_G00186130 [Megalops atlanticus]
MSHGKASFLAEEIPAPRKIFVVRKTKLSDEKATDITDANWLLRKVVFDEKTKMPFDRSSFAQGSSETPQMPSPARVKIPVPGKVKSRASSQAQVPKMAGRTAFINQMMNQMESKDFQQRIKAIDQLVADCNDNPSMVTSCIFQVFDVIKARLQESNRKVNLHMLEALGKIIPLLKDHLAKVVYILVPAIVESHLNSKNSAIYNAATRAINALTQNLDNALLLEMFVAKAQLLSGQAKADLTEKVADIVIQLHPRKPQMVEQQVLPLLWHLLSSYSNSRATATLCEALHSQMGPRLKMCATLQSLRVEKAVNQLLRTI